MVSGPALRSDRSEPGEDEDYAQGNMIINVLNWSDLDHAGVRYRFLPNPLQFTLEDLHHF